MTPPPGSWCTSERSNGLSERYDQRFYYPLQGYGGQDICAQAKDIASIVLSNIKAAN